MRTLLLILPFVLVACTAEQTPAPVVSVPAESQPRRVSEAAAEPIAASAADPAPTVQDLIGKSPAGIQAMIGEPTLVRRDDSVQTMLFETAACVLEIIYREPSTAAHFKAEHITARNTRGHDLDTTECLAAAYTAQK